MVTLAAIRLMLHRLAHPNRRRLPAPIRVSRGFGIAYRQTQLCGRAGPRSGRESSALGRARPHLRRAPDVLNPPQCTLPRPSEQSCPLTDMAARLHPGEPPIKPLMGRNEHSVPLLPRLLQGSVGGVPWSKLRLHHIPVVSFDRGRPCCSSARMKPGRTTSTIGATQGR
jgi:hypothetical protein